MYTNFNPVIVSQVLSKQAPTKFGLYFGHCASLCGSLGITNVEGLDALDFTYNAGSTTPYGSTVFYSTCGLTDAAIIRIPVQTSLSLALVLRASGQNEYWPADPSFTADAMLLGEIVLTIPIDDQTLRYTQVSASVHFTAHWLDSVTWPDISNVLFERVPLTKLIDDYASHLNSSFAKSIERQIKTTMIEPDGPLACTIPSFTKMTCTSEMANGGLSSAVACHPCDKCCKCFVQQRCDSECDQCPCVKCNKSQWALGLFGISFLMLFFGALLIIKCYRITFEHYTNYIL